MYLVDWHHVSPPMSAAASSSPPQSREACSAACSQEGGINILLSTQTHRQRLLLEGPEALRDGLLVVIHPIAGLCAPQQPFLQDTSISVLNVVMPVSHTAIQTAPLLPFRKQAAGRDWRSRKPLRLQAGRQVVIVMQMRRKAMTAFWHRRTGRRSSYRSAGFYFVVCESNQLNETQV